YRLGFARTRRQARQLVTHKHVMVNGVVTNVPSVQLRPGDKVEIRERSKSLELVNDAVSSSSVSRYPWLELDKNKLSGTFLTYPQRNEIPENIQERYIVELYSR
ncbi:MAG: 30S ribosomal protein S4, partial [Bacteroidota bacterium]